MHIDSTRDTGNLNIRAIYDKDVLLLQLKKHQSLRSEQYDTAVNVYYKDREELLKKLIKVAKASLKGSATANNIQDAYNKFFSTIAPVDVSSRYEHYISLLEHSMSDRIELDGDDAAALINDKWPWAIHAGVINSAYSSRNK
jgi:hypothetical protein